MTISRYSDADLQAYLQNDVVLQQLQNLAEYKTFATHEWLLSIPAKRLIYQDVYGELLNTKGKSILDIGGGFSGLTTVLSANHDYTLVDIMAHNHEEMNKLAKDLHMEWVKEDWFNFVPTKQYDYIIANDLFPNVDQRLVAFIKKFKPFAGTLVATLTCYESDRFYVTKRVDADEVLTVKPWNWGMTRYGLTEALPELASLLPEKFSKTETEAPLFANGRDVYKVVI